ncbi:hypothetical protein LTR62_007450 [Meristemomyces frigidus]|uniref:NAD(P)-binding domain-containing protein n=1 Tax=Meristemomyces frigidus TaxID=1508187 RepID=A0AAN7TH63_9PEZI|nr:hypothetical protein LTR62_007450 [Meristemomyces frigidus]
MALKIFITGATGYIGGDTLHDLHSQHPEHQYTALIRTKDKAAIVEKAYPEVKVVIGDLDNSELLEQQAAEADVVIHTADASDHAGAAKAIAAGLVKGHSKDSGRIGYWLHTGGTGILTYEDDEKGRLGEHSDKEYNDWSGVKELTNLPATAFHRNVDEIVLSTGEKHGDNVKVALVCPPTIYGRGRGPVATRGRQAYELTKLILTAQYIPVVGEGKARWNNVHVSDLARLFTLLVEAAAEPEKRSTDAGEVWGGNVYYFAENGEHVWTELAERIGDACTRLEYTGKLEKRALGKDEALEQAGFEAVSWGWNSRGKAERARKVLGWSPSGSSIEDEVPNMVREEHERLKEKS